MTDPHGNPNLLTAAADEKWKAIRKGVAVSFAFQNIKKKYPMILDRVNTVITRAAKLGPEASIDVDQLALRVTLDVIGLAGFGHDYQSVEKDVPEYDHLLVRRREVGRGGLGPRVWGLGPRFGDSGPVECCGDTQTGVQGLALGISSWSQASQRPLRRGLSRWQPAEWL
jgi:cytochrome P450